MSRPRRVRRVKKSAVFSHWQLFAAALFLAAVLISIPVQARDATVALDIDGSRRVFRGMPVEGMTVYDALRAASRDSDFRLRRDGELFAVVMQGQSSGYRVLTATLNGETLGSAFLENTAIGPGDEVVIFLSPGTPEEVRFQ